MFVLGGMALILITIGSILVFTAVDFWPIKTLGLLVIIATTIALTSVVVEHSVAGIPVPASRLSPNAIFEVPIGETPLNVDGVYYTWLVAPDGSTIGFRLPVELKPGIYFPQWNKYGELKFIPSRHKQP